MIVDTLRNHGLCYDQGHTRELQVDPATLDSDGQSERADEYLWQRYCECAAAQQSQAAREQAAAPLLAIPD